MSVTAPPNLRRVDGVRATPSARSRQGRRAAHERDVRRRTYSHRQGLGDQPTAYQWRTHESCDELRVHYHHIDGVHRIYGRLWVLLIQGVHDAEREDEVAATEDGRADGAGDEADADAVKRHELADGFESRRGAGY